MIKETFPIHKSEIKRVKNGIAAINRKAKKIDCDPIKLTFGDEYKVQRTTDYGRKYFIFMIDATVKYELPIINGWELICTFDIYTGKDNKSVVMTSTVPDKTVPPEYLNKTEIHCDHCGHTRNRTHSMLMHHTETGNYKEVGSTCIKDFFGHDPSRLLIYAGLDFSVMFKDEGHEDGFAVGGRGISATDLLETLIYTSATIRKYGWTSKKKAFEESIQATADELLNQMFPNPNMRDELKVELQERDKTIAEGCIAYFAELKPPTGNDYLWNCIKVAELGYVPLKHIGLVASMIPVYQRHLADLKAAEGDTSTHIGNIKDRLKEIPATVTFKKYFASDFGTSALYIFQGNDDNTYKCFYTGTTWDFEVDDKVLLTGTVKKHDIYKGKKSTMLSRCIVTRDV